MKSFLPVVKEINKTLRSIALFDTALNSVTVFLAMYCLLSLFNLYPYVAIVIALIYFIIRVRRKLNTVNLINVEKKYPGLYERLRTAADTITADNLIVHKLRYEVVTKLKNVKVSSFIDSGTLSLKVILICILFFLTIFITSLNLHFLDLKSAVIGTNIDFQFKDYVWGVLGKEGDVNPDDMLANENISEGAGNASFEDIYGEMSVAKLKDRKLEMVLDLEEDIADFKNIRDIEEKSFNEFPPEEVVTTPSDYDEAVIPKEQQKLVKDYFEQISR